MPGSRDITLAEKQQHPRHCPEVPADIFPPSWDLRLLGLCIIHDPKGVYYGGTVAAPVIRSIFENILPYLGIEKTGENSSEG